MRAIVAEYLVARALGCADGVREERAPSDLKTPEGVRVEVKTSAYLQTCGQKRLSVNSFDIARKTKWDRSTNTFTGEKRRLHQAKAGTSRVR